MSSTRCQKCGKQTGALSLWCPSCGYKKERQIKWFWVLAIILSTLLFFAYKKAHTFSGMAIQYDDSAIAACWEDYNSKAHEDPMKSSIKMFCNKLENRKAA